MHILSNVLQEGNVFTGICQSFFFIGVGRGYSPPAPRWILTPHPRHIGPGILRDTVYKRPVRILLECFHVFISKFISMQY